MINLRNATPRDIDEIMRLENQGFNENIVENQKIFESRIATFGNGFILGEIEEKIIAYMSTEKWQRKPIFSDEFFSIGHDPKKYHDDNGEVLYISSMTIMPEMRGKGIGKAFFENALLKICQLERTIKEIHLIVNVEWKSAHKIYINSNFKEIRRIENFFPRLDNGHDQAIYMIKNV